VTHPTNEPLFIYSSLTPRGPHGSTSSDPTRPTLIVFVHPAPCSTLQRSLRRTTHRCVFDCITPTWLLREWSQRTISRADATKTPPARNPSRWRIALSKRLCRN